MASPISLPKQRTTSSAALSMVLLRYERQDNSFTSRASASLYRKCMAPEQVTPYPQMLTREASRCPLAGKR